MCNIFRPLEKLEEELNDDEKPATPPPAKRPRKKSAKLKEAGDNMVNMKLLSDVSSEVTSSEDIPQNSKGKGNLNLSTVCVIHFNANIITPKFLLFCSILDHLPVHMFKIFLLVVRILALVQL